MDQTNQCGRCPGQGQRHVVTGFGDEWLCDGCAHAVKEDGQVEDLPLAVTIYGKVHTPIGRGEFPYDCDAARNHPNAMVYDNHDGGWTYEHALCFVERDKSLDVLA